MKTKVALTFLITFFITGMITAQEEQTEKKAEEMKLLFKTKNDKMDNGGYGAFQLGWTQIDGKSAITFGGSGAWVANHYFGLGLAGNGFYVDPSNSQQDDPSAYMLWGGYGGILMEPVIFPNALVHVSFPIIVGAGGIGASSANYYFPDYNYYYYDEVDPFFIFQPGVNVEFNIIKFFRLALGVSYKLTDGINLQYRYLDDAREPQVVNIDSKAMDGLNVTLTFKFGKF